MGYNELEIELMKIQAQIARWREMGYMPTIEQGIALARLQDVYARLMDLPCGEPHAMVENTERIDDVAMVIAPEVDEFPENTTGDDDSEEFVSSDDDTSGDFADLFAKEDEHISDETHLMQEYGAHDINPLPVESSQEDVVWVEDNEDNEEDVQQNVVEEKVEGSVAVLEDQLQSEPTEEVTPTQQVKTVCVFGIEVNAYARHEIIDTLFHGNIELFEMEMKKMDAMESLEDALVYIGETYNWVPENAATIKFIDLLEVRFGE